jgi:hypothetical protein
MNRREFLQGAALMGAAAVTNGCVISSGAETVDDNLSVFVSDLHIGGKNPSFNYTHEKINRVIDEILAMRPRPRRVVAFGDIALSYGLEADYAAAKPLLQRLVDAGIELHMTMGNHDRRSAFLKYWPEYGENQLLPGRFTRVVSLGHADIVLIDALKGADDRAETDMGPVEGEIDDAQLAWFDNFVAQAKRPFFVGSHQFRDLYIKKGKPISHAAKSPYFSGWIYGHDHSWCPDMVVASWSERLISPVLALPSTGLWGDIGYVVMRTSRDGANVSLKQSDFYFQNPAALSVRPRQWDARVRENQGKSTYFTFPLI